MASWFTTRATMCGVFWGMRMQYTVNDQPVRERVTASTNYGCWNVFAL